MKTSSGEEYNVLGALNFATKINNDLQMKYAMEQIRAREIMPENQTIKLVMDNAKYQRCKGYTAQLTMG